MAQLDDFIGDFYEREYRPAKHPGDAYRATCGEYRTQIANLNRFVQFPWWCERFASPSRGLPLSRVYEDFRWWLRHIGEPSPGEDGWPVLRLRDYSDSLVVGAMQFLVEIGRQRVTANKVRLHNNAIWRFAAKALAKQGVAMPVPDNENYRVDLGEPVALMPEELERVIEAARSQTGMVGTVPAGVWWPAAILFVLSLGVRITAATSIPTENLDLVRGEVRVPAWCQKQRREQWLDLFPSVTQMLRELRIIERGLPTVLGDWSLTILSLRRHYKRIIVSAEIGYKTVDEIPSSLMFHCLRRTLGSMLFEKHGIHVASERLGHSSIEVTRRYIDPRYGSRPRVSDLLEDPCVAATPPPLRIVSVG